MRGASQRGEPPRSAPHAWSVAQWGGGGSPAAPPNGTLAQAVLHVTFSWLATFNGFSSEVAKITCSIEKKSPTKSDGAERYLVVSRGTFQRALKIRSWSLETTSCVSAPQLHSSGGSSCRTDLPLSTASCAADVGLQLFRVNNFSWLPSPPQADPPAQQHLVGV